MIGFIIWLLIWVSISFFISKKTKSRVTSIGGGFIASLIVIIIFFMIKEPGSVQKAFHKPTKLINACLIAEAFSKDEVSAIAKYKGKKLTIEGKAGTKGNSLLGGLYLQFSCRKSWSDIQCFFKDSKASDLARVSQGQTVVVKGKCKGKTLGTVLFDNCSIIE